MTYQDAPPGDSASLAEFQRWVSIRLSADTMLNEDELLIGGVATQARRDWVWDLCTVRMDDGADAASRWTRDNPSPD